jgi:chromosome segregation ATPase
MDTFYNSHPHNCNCSPCYQINKHKNEINKLENEINTLKNELDQSENQREETYFELLDIRVVILNLTKQLQRNNITPIPYQLRLEENHF